MAKEIKIVISDEKEGKKVKTKTHKTNGVETSDPFSRMGEGLAKKLFKW